MSPHIGAPAASNSPTRGRLQILLGASAGLSSVRLLLEKARLAKKEGVDVIVARVSFKGDFVVTNLLKDLECLPELQSPYGPAYVSSVDVLAVQRRYPAVVVVDTSMPLTGKMRSASLSADLYAPWKDIESLLDAGIDVWASLDASPLGSWISAVTGDFRGDTNRAPRIKHVKLGL